MPVIVEEAIAAAPHGPQRALPALEVTVARGPIRLRLLSLGAAIRSLEVPDAAGDLGHVHLELPAAADYADMARNPHLGATVGRYANRIGHARFALDGTEFALDANRPPNTLHGGTWGFDRLVWSLAEAVSGPDSDRIVFRLESPAGDMGFPGTLVAESVYEIGASTLTCSYRAVTDAPTVVSLANHGYWNLSGERTVAGHRLQVAAGTMLESDSEQLPTGRVVPVDGTPFDLRAGVLLGDAIAAVPGGLDHCLVVDGADLARDGQSPLRRAAVLEGGSRWMTVSTDAPGLQVYTGNSLHSPFTPHQSVSLEAQRLPDAPNHPHLGPCVLRPGEEYRSTTVLEFGVGQPPSLV